MECYNTWNEILCETTTTDCKCQAKLIDYEMKGKFISATYWLKLSSEGKGGLTFNISQIQMFTIAVENNEKNSVQGYLAISPNKQKYKIEPQSKCTVKSGDLQVFVGKIFLKYTSIKIEGMAEGIVYIYFQGQY